MKCALTGGNGYVGSVIAEALAKQGHQIVILSRKTKSNNSNFQERNFNLGQQLDPTLLEGIDILVHCAYDFTPLTWPDIYKVNVEGTSELFKAARQAGVKKIVYISSISAFDGCVSLYGKAKLMTEQLCQEYQAVIIRPGLVYGNKSGGMVGKLQVLCSKLPIIPVIAASTKMYLCQQDQLAEIVVKSINSDIAPQNRPIIAASEVALPFIEILRRLAGKSGNRVILIPVPWWPAWLGLKFLELLGIRLAFKSDSLISLVNSDPKPDFDATRSMAIRFKEF